MNLKINKGDKVLIIGSGPIVIGQACEFDYSGTQACKVLREKGYQVVLVNSNPATIMTDPDMADSVYIEPLELPFLLSIIEKEKPQAIIPTLGGQTALNLGLALNQCGILEKYQIQLLGSSPKTIELAEDREKFRNILSRLKAGYPKSVMVRSFEQALPLVETLGLPLILRPNYTLGGGGGGIAYSLEEYHRMIVQALNESPTTEVLVEESILGWYEYELELMRDSAGTSMVVCSMENIDPCGVHTGDSITVAPQQTLSDYEYQEMRLEAFKIAEAVGLETGGANVQFAVHPETRRRVVIEMNPRVSRSSALASKATGFPIAKIAALVAVGYCLDEIQNDITKVTPSSYEPALDYVVTKIPHFAFEKFPGSKDLLDTQMKSVGEVMAIGRTFKESLMKALLSLEQSDQGCPDIFFQVDALTYPNSQRLKHLFQAFRHRFTVDQVHKWSGIHPFFLEQIQSLVDFEFYFKGQSQLSSSLLWKAKKMGFSDARLAALRSTEEFFLFELRNKWDIRPGYHQVDTCAGEFQSSTPYYYSSYWGGESSSLELPESVAVIGSGPNRIGQGIEFDYSCVRAAWALKKEKYPVVMINSNPETVSTDYDTSDILFFEPLTTECVHEIFRVLRPRGFIAQLGGQTPIKLMFPLVKRGWKVLGSSVETVQRAEDRKLFAQICESLSLKIPQSGLASKLEQAVLVAEKICYPLIARPSYVLGGRRMEVIENQEELESYFHRNFDVISEKNPCYLDHFLEGALEIDVDLISDGHRVVIGGVLEHIESTGVHSGDSMAVLPPQRLKKETLYQIETLAKVLALHLGVKGFLNIQLALKNDDIYIIEANPRSSRTLPFIAKATKRPLVDMGIQAILKGESFSANSFDSIQDRSFLENLKEVFVKGVVFPFRKFPDSDPLLSPEMKSTGETMGRASHFDEALMKAMVGAGIRLPEGGEIFFSLKDQDKELMLPIAQRLIELGFCLSATTGTAQYFLNHGVPVTSLKKIFEGRPHCVDRIRSGQVRFVVNTTRGRKAVTDGFMIRRACIDLNIPCITKVETAKVFIQALEKFKTKTIHVMKM
jgi:carbamoyl-phosphate synthase large subunit